MLIMLLLFHLGKDNDISAFHTGIQGPTGQKGSKGDYGSKGLKGEPGVKGAKGDPGNPGKAVCHVVSVELVGLEAYVTDMAQIGTSYSGARLQEELNRQMGLSRG